MFIKLQTQSNAAHVPDSSSLFNNQPRETDTTSPSNTGSGLLVQLSNPKTKTMMWSSTADGKANHPSDDQVMASVPPPPTLFCPPAPNILQTVDRSHSFRLQLMQPSCEKSLEPNPDPTGSNRSHSNHANPDFSAQKQQRPFNRPAKLKWDPSALASRSCRGVLPLYIMPCPLQWLANSASSSNKDEKRIPFRMKPTRGKYPPPHPTACWTRFWQEAHLKNGYDMRVPLRRKDTHTGIY